MIYIDDQLAMDIDPFQRDFDNEIIFKENAIENMDMLENKEYIKELNRISIVDIYKLEKLTYEYLNIADKIDEIISLEEEGVRDVNEWVKKNKSYILTPLRLVLTGIKKTSMFVYNIVKGTFSALWSWLKNGPTLRIGLSVASIRVNLRFVLAVLGTFLIAARQYSRAREKQKYDNRIKQEKLGNENREVSLEDSMDKKIKVIKNSDLIRLISSYKNILRSCEKMLDNIAIFKYNTLNEMNKEIRGQDLKILQLTLDGSNIKREKLKMERNTVKSLGYTMDIKKYESMKSDLFKDYETFIKKEISFVPKVRAGNNDLRQVAKMIRVTDKIAYISYKIADYHINRAINSIKYVQ